MHFLGGSINNAITALWICVFLKFIIIDNTTAVPYNKKHGGARHVRVKRTLPFERFRQELRGPGFGMMPGPPFRPEGFPETTPFGFQPGPPVRFPPSGFRRGGPFTRPEVCSLINVLIIYCIALKVRDLSIQMVLTTNTYELNQ